eukprot:6191656-Pleurochrysis_carterae.AAC.3
MINASVESASSRSYELRIARKLWCWAHRPAKQSAAPRARRHADRSLRHSFADLPGAACVAWRRRRVAACGSA